MSMFTRGRQLMDHVLPAVIRPMRVVWNQVIGFVFLVLGLWAVPSAVRSVREFDGDAESFFRVLLTSLFILMMGGFAVSSFLRARRASR